MLVRRAMVHIVSGPYDEPAHRLPLPAAPPPRIAGKPLSVSACRQQVSRYCRTGEAPYWLIVSVPFPSPTNVVASREQVFLGYLDFFRAQTIVKLDGLDEAVLRASMLASGWAPLELLKHLIAMERRWLVWGFAGEDVGDPWSDERDERWHVSPDETFAGLVEQLHAGGRRTRSIVESRSLDDAGAPGERWAGEAPATLERVLFHVLQEYARHLGHLDIARELIDGSVGE